MNSRVSSELGHTDRDRGRHRRTQNFTSPPMDNGVQGQNPGSGSGGQSPQKLKQNLKLAYNF